MRKIKYILATILSAFLVMLSIVVGGKVVNAEEDNYALDLSAITVGSDKTTITSETFGSVNNAFLEIETTNVTQRVKDNSIYCIEIKDSALSVNFKGTGSIIVGFCSTGGSNESHFGLTNDNDEVLDASEANATLISTGADAGYYSVTGTTPQTVTYSIEEAGKYYLDAPSASTNRGARIYSITMNDNYGDITYYSVTYYVDNEIVRTDAKVVEGASITYSPSYDDYGFDGWYTDSNCSQALASNYTVDSNIDLYGKKVVLSNNLDQAHMITYAGGAITHYNNTIFNFIDKGTEIVVETNTTKTLPDGSTSSYRINKANASAADNRLITFKAPYDGTVKVWAAAGNDNKNFYICETTYSTSSYIAMEATPTKNELFELTADIESGKTYAIGGDSRFYIYGIFVEEASSTADSANVAIEAQQSTDGTAVRFITTLTGVDAIDVTSWNVTLTYNGGSEVTTSSFTTLYLAVVNTKEAADGTYYLVFTVSEIPSEANGKVITAAMTVTFEDGSSITTLVKEETILQIA